MTDRKISYNDKQMIQGYCHKIFRWYRWLNSRNIRPHLREKIFKLLKCFKIYSNLSSPFATSYSVQNAVFNNLPEALTSAKAALFDSGVGGGGGVSPYHRLLGIYTKVIRMFSWTNLHPFSPSLQLSLSSTTNAISLFSKLNFY